jgi:hypothetical protein
MSLNGSDNPQGGNATVFFSRKQFSLLISAVGEGSFRPSRHKIFVLLTLASRLVNEKISLLQDEVDRGNYIPGAITLTLRQKGS